MDRLTCHFRGQVQGVGFRYTAQNLALRYNVKGYVRNLPDGRVELVMEGPDADMQALLRDLQEQMNGFIQGVETVRSPATGQFQRFCIKH